MAWEASKIVAGVWIYQSDASILNTWVRFAGDQRGWMRVLGLDREDCAAMFTLLVNARYSGQPIAADIQTAFGLHSVSGISG